MHIDFTPEHKALRKEIREYYRQLFTPELRARLDAEYEEMGGPVDAIYKVINMLGMTHPFHTLRAAELQNWIDSGSYERMLGGEYTHRGAEEKERPITADIGEAAKHYADEARQTVSQMTEAAKKAASAFTDAFKGKK